MPTGPGVVGASPPKPVEPGPPLSAAAVADRLDRILVPLHHRRVAEQGVDPSGLFDHYKQILDSGRIAARRGVSDLAHMIVLTLPRFDSYHVLRAGLGELAFVLAGMGLKVLACEAITQRFGAVEAGIRELTESAPNVAQRVTAVYDAIPEAVPGKSVLCIAHHLMGFSVEQEDDALALLSRYDAILIEPRIFLRMRQTLEEQEAAVEALRSRGFTTIREFSGLGVVYCAKPSAPPMPIVTVRSEFPAVTNIVDALRAMPLEETGRHNIRLGSVGKCLHAHRDQAAYALDRLDKLGVKPSVYVNHSSSVSNVGGPWGWYQHADDPDHPFYCMDLIKAFGFKYFWIDDCINFEKFGDHLEYPTQQNLERAIHQFPWSAWLRRRNYEGEISYLEFPGDDDAHRRLLTSFFNRTLIRVNGRDGQPLLAFKRHRGFDQPIMSTFCNQVTDADLDALEKMHGVVIVYQHFGRKGPRGRSPALSRALRSTVTSPAFDEHARARLRSIAERYRAGRLWVALQSRLLDYLWLRETLRFQVERGDAKWVVTVEEIGCDATGRRPLEEGDFNGLSFSVPSNAPEIVVAVQGRNGILPVRRAQDPGWPGRDAVFMPWLQLEWPI